MGSIEFEGWRVKLNDINVLNHSQEIMKIGLVFEQIGDCTFANFTGDILNHYEILGEVMNQINSGSFYIKIEDDTGKKSTVLLTSNYVIENNKEISSIFGL